MNDQLTNLVEKYKRLLILVGVLIVIAIIAIANHKTQNLNSQPAANTQSTSNKAPKKAKPVVTGPLPNLTNTSSQNDDPTNNFVVAANWGIEWSYDCTNDDPPGTFSIFVQNPDGSPSNVDNAEIDTNGYKGNGIEQENLSGTYQLAIIVDPACTWSVQVINNSPPTTTNDASAPTKAKANTTAPKATPTPAPAAPVFLLNQSGSGQASTASFTTNDNWSITYTFDCTNYGSEGNFQIYINNTDNSENDDVGANALAMSGGSTDHYTDAGSHYLQINSECNWTVKVTD